MLSRRQVLASAALGAAHLALSPHLVRAGSSRRSFSFILLGDLHLDQLHHHDMEWLAREKPNDVRQVENYSRITRDITPLLFDAVRRRIAESPRPIPFIVQIGDFVEGLCGNETLARLHCEDAVKMVQEARFGVPFLITKGNHDITGPGAVEAYNEILLPFTTPRLVEQVDGACYVVRHEGSMFAFFDAYLPPSLDWLEAALATRTAADERVFFLIHPPVVPYTARCWHIFNRPNQTAQRTRLLELLARHDAIVLNGHLHKLGLLTRRANEGSLRQFAVASVLPEATPRPRDVIDDPERYGPDLVRLEERFSPDTVDHRRAILEQEAPFVADYWYADAPGYAVVHVDPDTVEADIHIGFDATPWRRVRLR